MLLFKKYHVKNCDIFFSIFWTEHFYTRYVWSTDYKGIHIYHIYIYISFPPISVTKVLLHVSGIPITRARSRNVNGNEEIENLARSSPSEAEVDVGKFRK